MSFSGNTAEKPEKLAPEDELTPRIIQYHGKRVCIRLEDIYWDVFEDVANTNHCKLNELIHQYYTDPRAKKNRTAFLRRQAVEWLSNQVEAANERLNLGNSEIKSVLKVTIQPAIIFSECQNVSRYNEAFRDWLIDNTAHKGKHPDLDKLRVSFRRSFNCLMSQLDEQKGAALNEQVSILLPGYVFAERMNLVKLHKHSEHGQLFLGILSKVASAA